MSEKRSPINGQPLPKGRKFQAGEQARENGRKGGRVSAEKKKQLKTMKEDFLLLLQQQKPDNSGKMISVQEGIITAIVAKAAKGDTRAFEIIRDTIGQKPVEHMEVDMPDYSALDSIIYGHTIDTD